MAASFHCETISADKRHRSSSISKQGLTRAERLRIMARLLVRYIVVTNDHSWTRDGQQARNLKITKNIYVQEINCLQVLWFPRSPSPLIISVQRWEFRTGERRTKVRRGPGLPQARRTFVR